MNDAENLTKLLNHLPRNDFREFMINNFDLVMPELNPKENKLCNAVARENP